MEVSIVDLKGLNLNDVRYVSLILEIIRMTSNLKNIGIRTIYTTLAQVSPIKNVSSASRFMIIEEFSLVSEGFKLGTVSIPKNHLRYGIRYSNR